MADEAQKAGEAGNADNFDPARWHEELAALNEWAEGLDPEEEPENRAEPWTTAFARARRRWVLSLWGEGRNRWNAWAEPMLALKARLEAAGKWKKGEIWEREDQFGPEQRRYRALAGTDFAGLCLPGGADFSGFVFPGPGNFDKTQFGDKEASPGDASFDGAQFSGGEA